MVSNSLVNMSRCWLLLSRAPSRIMRMRSALRATAITSRPMVGIGVGVGIRVRVRVLL
jgi:hypothetical protein